MKLKLELKTLALEIRSLKSQRKSFSSGYVPGLISKQYNYRHMHIAYCLMRGRTIEQIENKVREHNAHDERLVQNYINQYTEVLNETLHTGG